MLENVKRIKEEEGLTPADSPTITSNRLRGELRAKGLKGFRRGGKVKKTGPAKLHKGERVLTAKTAKKVTPAKLRAVTRKPAPRARKR